MTEMPFQDYRSNPPLHHLHVIWAMEHLVLIKKAIKKLSRSNWNWNGPVAALHSERRKLINEDAAYQEAAWRLTIGQRVRKTYDENGVADDEIYDRVTDIVIPKPLPNTPETVEKAPEPPPAKPKPRKTPSMLHKKTGQDHEPKIVVEETDRYKKPRAPVGRSEAWRKRRKI